MSTWDQYRTQYQDHLSALAEATLVAKAAGDALTDFPKRLPKDARQGFETMLEKFHAMLSETLDWPEEDANRPHEASVHLEDAQPDLFLPWITIVSARVLQGQPIEQLDFQRALFSQQLITIIAHTEAFLGDTLRVICYAQPEIIEFSQKQVSWEAALSYRDRESLFAAFVDDYTMSRIRKTSLKGFVTSLSKEHGLNADLDPEKIASITLGEQVRHLLVHNGGRVDHQFIRRTGIHTIQPGEKYLLDEKLVREVSVACETVVEQVFLGVAKKYFGIEDPRAAGILKHTWEE